MPADRAPRLLSSAERQTWSWFARWATVARAFAVAQREGLAEGPARLRRARQLLDPRASDDVLDALVAHMAVRAAAGERNTWDPPRLVDMVGSEMAHRIVEAGLIEGVVAERELRSADEPGPT
jgi:hypothetical protein